MKIHVISETDMVMKATGVHTAFIDHVQLLKQSENIEVFVNNEGYGDVFHSHTYGLYYFLKGLRYRGRKVFTAHVIPDSVKGSLPMWELFMPLVKAYLRLIYSYADVCIAISPHVEKAILDTKANTRIVRIDNPVRTEIWKRTDYMRRKGKEMLGVDSNEFVVLGVGQVLGRKGVDDFIEISKCVPEARFIWAGGRPFGKLTEGIKRLDEKFAMANRNLFRAGPFDVSLMPYIYSAGDLLLFPSLQENCPLTPIEAAASGMPVIFRDLDEYKSLYENTYIKAGTLSEFVNLTRRMIYDRNYYEEGLEISKRLLVQFDKERIKEKLILLYNDLIENRENAQLFARKIRTASS